MLDTWIYIGVAIFSFIMGCYCILTVMAGKFGGWKAIFCILTHKVTKMEMKTTDSKDKDKDKK